MSGADDSEDEKAGESEGVLTATERLQQSLDRQREAIASFKAGSTLTAAAEVVKKIEEDRLAVESAMEGARRMNEERAELLRPRFSRVPDLYTGPTMDEILEKNMEPLAETLPLMLEALDQQTNSITLLLEQAREDSTKGDEQFDETRRLERKGIYQNWLIIVLTIAVPISLYLWPEDRASKQLPGAISELSAAVTDLRKAVSEGELEPVEAGGLSATVEDSSTPAQLQPAPTPAGAPSDNAPSSSHQREP